MELKLEGRPNPGLRDPFAFSRDGALLAAITGETTVRVWDVASGQERAVFLGNGEPITARAFSPGGKLLATSSMDGTVRLWNPRHHPAGLALDTRGKEGYLAALDFSLDGSTIHTAISAPNGAAVETWDVSSGRAAQRHQIDATRFRAWPRSDFVFSPDRRYLAAPADGNRAVLCLFEVATGRLSNVAPPQRLRDRRRRVQPRRPSPGVRGAAAKIQQSGTSRSGTPRPARKAARYRGSLRKSCELWPSAPTAASWPSADCGQHPAS